MNEMKMLIAAIDNTKLEEKYNPIIIVDNINSLERTENLYNKISDFEKALHAARDKGIKVIAISSSSLYIDKFRQNRDVK